MNCSACGKLFRPRVGEAYLVRAVKDKKGRVLDRFTLCPTCSPEVSRRLDWFSMDQLGRYLEKHWPGYRERIKPSCGTCGGEGYVVRQPSGNCYPCPVCQQAVYRDWETLWGKKGDDDV